MRPLVLSIDPGTKCGIAILEFHSGDVVEAFTVKSATKKDTNWGVRANNIIAGFREMCQQYYEDIGTICYEKNHTTSVIVKAIPILFAAEIPEAFMSDKTGVVPSTWKKLVRDKHPIPMSSCKGCVALDLIAPGIVDEFNIDDDAADAVLIGMAWIKSFKAILASRG